MSRRHNRKPDPRRGREFYGPRPSGDVPPDYEQLLKDDKERQRLLLVRFENPMETWDGQFVYDIGEINAQARRDIEALQMLP
jgi:hypothetical protein